MTALIVDHTESLEYASSTAFDIHETLDKAAAAAKSWDTTFGKFHYENILRFSIPPITLVLGSWGLNPSLARNFGLLAAGKLSSYSPFVTGSLMHSRMDHQRIIHSIPPLDTQDPNISINVHTHGQSTVPEWGRHRELYEFF